MGSRGSSPPPANRKLSLAGRPRPILFPRQTKIDLPLSQRRVDVSECGVEREKAEKKLVNLQETQATQDANIVFFLILFKK